MRVVVIKYNAGNTRSVSFALERLGIRPEITDNAERILSADKVIFPGVGEASSAMNFLRERKMDILINSLKQPILGICLGMQLMCNYSEEGNVDCLGIFPLQVRKFSGNEKIPQIGWNNIQALKGNLFRGIKENDYMYFVHSYYAEIGSHTIARTNYMHEYSSALSRDNFYGVQFHPEKSSLVGGRLIKNFIEL